VGIVASGPDVSQIDNSAHPFDIQCYDERFLGPENPESILEIHVPVKSRKE
jgi:hypothetical protein